MVPTGPGDVVHGPQVLPDGQTLLLTLATGTAGDRWEKASIVAYSLKSGEHKTLIEGGSDARYLSTGHIVYAKRMAVRRPFRFRRLEVTASPVRVVEGVGGEPSRVQASRNLRVGPACIYVVVRRLYQLAIIDRNGEVRPFDFPLLLIGTLACRQTARDSQSEPGDGDESIVWVGEVDAAERCAG